MTNKAPVDVLALCVVAFAWALTAIEALTNWLRT